jgi:hypothetical protein
LDISSCRYKLALVDEANAVVVYDINTKVGTVAVAWTAPSGCCTQHCQLVCSQDGSRSAVAMPLSAARQQQCVYRV